MIRRRGIVFFISLLWVSVLPHKSESLFGVGDIVIDPTNLVQTTLTAYNTLNTATNTYREVQQSIQMVKGQIQQLQNDATNLLRSPFTIAQEVLTLGQQMTRMLDVNATVSFDASQALATFQEYYPQVQHLLSANEAVAMRQTWVTHQRQALNTAVLTQSVLTSMIEVIAQACRLLNSTHTARGALEIGQIQAMQAGLQHHMTHQQTQMTAAAERHKALKEAQVLAQEEAAILAHQDAHKPFATTYQPQGKLMNFTRP